MSDTAIPATVLPPVSEEPAALAPETPAAAVEQETKPGLLERISASLQTKTGLLAEVATFRTRAETAEAALEEATADLTAARAELTTLRNERAAIIEKLSTAEKASAAEQIAADKIAATIGFKAEELPAAESEPPVTKEQLLAQLSAEQDNAKRYALAEQINSMN